MTHRGNRIRRLRHRITQAEQLLWKQLQRRQQLGHKFRRRYPLVGHILDFVCLPAGVVVEVKASDGARRSVYQMRREEALQRLGFKLLRFDDQQITLAMDDVLAQIRLSLLQRGPDSSNATAMLALR